MPTYRPQIFTGIAESGVTKITTRSPAATVIEPEFHPHPAPPGANIGIAGGVMVPRCTQTRCGYGVSVPATQ